MKAIAAIALALLLAALASAGSAAAEKQQSGNLLVSFDGGISPHALPRRGTAPVSVTVDSSFATTDESDPPPQLRRIAIAINRGGRIFDRGLPTCRVQRIQPSTIAAAKRICGGAIVGNGHVQVRVNLANQPPFTFKGPMLVFHATRAGGHRRLLAQVYGTRPPSAFVLTFKILRRKGTFGTLIKTSLPQAARKWAYVTHFDMKLRRPRRLPRPRLAFTHRPVAGRSTPSFRRLRDDRPRLLPRHQGLRPARARRHGGRRVRPARRPRRRPALRPRRLSRPGSLRGRQSRRKAA